MDNKGLSDVVTGVFRLRKNHPHMAGSTIVDLQDEDVCALTTVEVSEGVVTLHCFSSWQHAEAEDMSEEDDEHEKDDEEDDDEKDKDDDEEEDEDDGHSKDDKDEDDDERDAKDDEEEDEEEERAEQRAPRVRSYTVADGNSVTVRAAVIRLEPVGKQMAEGTYRIQMVKSAY
jgi:hypothetical protein